MENNVFGLIYWLIVFSDETVKISCMFLKTHVDIPLISYLPKNKNENFHLQPKDFIKSAPAWDKLPVFFSTSLTSSVLIFVAVQPISTKNTYFLLSHSL